MLGLCICGAFRTPTSKSCISDTGPISVGTRDQGHRRPAPGKPGCLMGGLWEPRPLCEAGRAVAGPGVGFPPSPGPVAQGGCEGCGSAEANNGRLARAAHATQKGDEWSRSLGQVGLSSRYPPSPWATPRLLGALTLGAPPLSRPSCDHRVPDGGPAGPGAVLREHAAPRGVLGEQEVPGVPSARSQACSLASGS